MKTNLLLASLLAVSSFATAAPRVPSPPGPPTEQPVPVCGKVGDVLFQIETKLEMPTYKVPTSHTKLFASGGWVHIELDDTGKPTRVASGCLSNEQLTKVETALKRATWKVEQAEAACAAVSSTYTEYSSHGKVLWDQHMCQLTYLDKDSDQALSTISRLLDDVSKPGPLEGAPAKR